MNVECGQVTEEEHACQVKKTSHKKYYCELFAQIFPEHIHWVGDPALFIGHLEVNVESTGECVHWGHKECDHN